MRSDDLSTLFAGHRGQPDVGFRQGRLVAWNAQTGENAVELAGHVFTDLPVLAASGISLTPGDVVGLLRYQSTYLLLGRINTVDNQHTNAAGAGIVGLSTAKFNDWPSTTNASFEELYAGWIRRAGSELAFFARTFAAAGTSGEYAVYIDDVQVATDTVTGGAAGSFGTFTEQQPWGGEVDWENFHVISFRARRTAGGGVVSMSVQGLAVT